MMIPRNFDRACRSSSITCSTSSSVCLPTPCAQLCFFAKKTPRDMNHDINSLPGVINPAYEEEGPI